MRRSRLLLAMLALGGCRQVLGFDDPTVVVGDATSTDSGDAPTDASDALDAPASPPAGWTEPAYHHRRLITVAPIDSAAPLDDFPLLIKLPSAGGGTIDGNVRIKAADGITAVPFQLDSIVGDQVFLWVRCSIEGTGGAPTQLWVYYDYSPVAGSLSDGAAVFADKFTSVHHFGLTPQAAFVDSTGHGHDGTSPTAATPAVLADDEVRRGGVASLDEDDYLELADGDSPFDFTTTLYISAWVKHPMPITASWTTLVSKGFAWTLETDVAENDIGFKQKDYAVIPELGTSAEMNFVDGAWHHVAVVKGATAIALYYDGEAVFSTTDGAADAPLVTNDRVVAVGSNRESNGRYWNGYVDEVRIGSTVRTSAWIRAEFDNVQNTSGDFPSVGAEEAW